MSLSHSHPSLARLKHTFSHARHLDGDPNPYSRVN
uniref:Uncharacterized protein n=1 Tax=Rhizophora mucronata TaxID=61149 RepID=A0A2P2MYB6_RHIMU